MGEPAPPPPPLPTRCAAFCQDARSYRVERCESNRSLLKGSFSWVLVGESMFWERWREEICGLWNWLLMRFVFIVEIEGEFMTDC